MLFLRFDISQSYVYVYMFCPIPVTHPVYCIRMDENELHVFMIWLQRCWCAVHALVLCINILSDGVYLLRGPLYTVESLQCERMKHAVNSFIDYI